MITAFVLARTNNGKEKNAISDLLKVNEIKEAHSTYGDYDLLIKVEAENTDELNDILLRKIKSLPYIAGTNTIIDL